MLGYLVIHYYILNKWIHLLKRVYGVHMMSGTATGQPENYFRTQEQLSLNVPYHILEISTYSFSELKNLLDIPPGENNNMYIFY